MAQPLSPLQRSLAPLAGTLWIAFWVWTALAALIWGAGIGDAEAAAWVHRHFSPGGETIVGEVSPLQQALNTLLALVDPVWIVLAAVNSYLSVAAEEGLANARRWSGWILLAALVLAWLTAKAGYPLGALLYTSRLGPRLGPVPLGYPLLWLVLVLGGRQLALLLWPRGAHVPIAVATGTLALLTDLNLEPIASHVRVWWLASAGRPSAANYLTYALAGAALAWLCRSGGSLVHLRKPRLPHAAAAFLALNALCLLAHLARP